MRAIAHRPGYNGRAMLDGLHCLVIGGSGDLGRAIVAGLLGRRAVVDATYHAHPEPLESLAPPDGRLRLHRVDVRDAEAVDRLAADLAEAGRVPDVLVYNVGIVRDAPALALDDRVVAEVRAGLAGGSRDICLAGDDLGCWGSDAGLSLADLLDALVKLPGAWRLHLRFVEPFWLIRLLDRLLPALRSGRVAGFCVPLQSGSQRILDAMNRRYRISDAVAAVNRVITGTRVRSLSSIVMVGFPGETAEDFARTYALVERARIPLYQALRYEGRPGTPSESLPGAVPEELKDARQARFRMKMRLVRFARLPPRLAERIVERRLGPLR